MKRCLFVQYADGREDIFPFAEGQSTLGSDSSCEYGIQAEGVAARHIAFAHEESGSYVINLQNAETVRLNGIPLEGRRAFEIYDELAIGSVRVGLRHVADEGENLAESPNGVDAVAASVGRAGRAGWRGYRKILEAVAPFISPTEASMAERLHHLGNKALGQCMLVILAIAVAAGLLDAHRHFLPADICRCSAAYLELFFALALTVRYRIRCSGRLFSLLFVLDWWQSPPVQTWTEYFGEWGTGTITMVFLPFVYFYGWGIDVGAGCLFHKRRSRCIWEYFLLLLSVGLPCALAFLVEQLPEGQSPVAPGWYLPLLAVAGLYPLWGRLVPRKWVESEVDVAFVAEQASRRLWRRWLARGLTLLAIGTPLLYLLTSLGMGERVGWQMSDDLVVSKVDDGETQAWYWVDRGRYLKKSDFASESIYQVPFDALLPTESDAAVDGEGQSTDDFSFSSIFSQEAYLADKTTSVRDDIWKQSWKFRAQRFFARNGVDPDDDEARTSFLESDAGKKAADAFAQDDANAVLSDLGEDLCRKIASVQLDATNAAAFAELQTALAPYRVTVPDWQDSPERQLGGEDTLFFFLEVSDNRASYTSVAEPKLHHAQVGIGVWSMTKDAAKRWIAQVEALVVPCLVLLVLGGLLLWTRGADSPVGFWLGIAMSMNVLAVFDALGIDGEPLGKMLRYPLWHWATQSPLGGLVSGGVATLRASGSFFESVSYLAQSVLFVLLCWPSPATARWGRLRRFLVFAGKASLSCCVGMAAAFASGKAFEHWISNGEAESILVPRIAAIAVLGIWGACLRRKRRFDTEAPELGWRFFACWLLSEIAVLFPFDVPESWLEPMEGFWGDFPLVGWLAGFAGVVGGVLFIRLCLKRSFLAVLTAAGFTFTLFSFSVPVLAAIGNTLVGRLFAGSFLQSEQGERIIAIAMVVLVMRPLWNVLGKIARRLSVRNLGRVEAGINATLEAVLDRVDNIDVRDEIFARLRELGVERYAFFAWSSDDTFDLILKNGWNVAGAEAFRMSPYLRHCLGVTPQVVDLNRLGQDGFLFFQAFELCRIGQRLHASCLLPICLGKSVRAVLVTPDIQNGRPMPQVDAFLENVNALGLATVESLGRGGEVKSESE